MSTSRKKAHGVSEDELNSYQQQCAAIAKDWARLQALIGTYSQPGAPKEEMEWELIALKGRLACDYPVLTHWRKGGFGLSAGINKMLTGATNLSSMADSASNPESRVNRTWREVQSSLQQVQQTLSTARTQLERGKEAVLPDALFEEQTHRAIPWKKIARGAAIILGVVVLVFTLYVMRNFLGFWAPEAGEGLIVDESMSNEDKINSVLVILNESFKRDDVDMFMTVFADDFKDDEGNGKTAMRIFMQAYHEKGDFKQVTMNWSDMRLAEEDGYIVARPIRVQVPDEEIIVHLGFKAYRGKLLIATGTAP